MFIILLVFLCFGFSDTLLCTNVDINNDYYDESNFEWR